MQLRRVNEQLKAYITSIDQVISELKSFDEFQVSDRVAGELQKHPNLLDIDYWCLVIKRDKETDSVEWEISVFNTLIQVPVEGNVEFNNGLPVLV
jgi:hypothetical protein